MCGIFGLIVKDHKLYSDKQISSTLKKLALLSEVRGKDSSGFAFHNESKVDVLKGNIPISSLLRTQDYQKLLTFALNGNNFSVIGHSRLVTNGSQLEPQNNQPVVKNNNVCVHNGIITNVNKIWRRNSNYKRKSKIDTEIILDLLHEKLSKKPIDQSIEELFDEIEGTASIAVILSKHNSLLLTSNNGSLYTLINNEKSVIIFASEKYMLITLAKNNKLINKIGQYEIKQIKAGSGYLLDLNNFTLESIENNPRILEKKKTKLRINILLNNSKTKKYNEVLYIDKIIENSNSKHEINLLEFNIDRISKLKRCSKCLLPETFPFIEFDESGECNYCKKHKKRQKPKSFNELKKLIEPYRSKDGSPDVIIPFSGGRDSSYLLHLVKNELGLNPITYTYDWGMVTDLARRNIARMCGKLGVENIIVSADINMKRTNIRKNINAWLKKPDLGMIPLFMAGDKQFFKYCNQVKKQAEISLNIWGINFLENTDFKVGFCGVRPDFNKKMIYSMSLIRKLKLFIHVGKNFITNPDYINSSLFDTAESFVSRYFNPRKDYYHFFDYYYWDENEINDVLINEYNWETAKDLDSTWRIGDGTASFYNYIYYTVAGFSEFDTFRSNQIREGMITREQGLEFINKENIPRYNSLKWYLEILGLDFETVIKRVNQIPKLYEN